MHQKCNIPVALPSVLIIEVNEGGTLCVFDQWTEDGMHGSLQQEGGGGGGGGGTVSCRGRKKKVEGKIRLEKKEKRRSRWGRYLCVVYHSVLMQACNHSVFMCMVVWGLVSKLVLLKFKVTLTESLNYINWCVIPSELETGSDALFPLAVWHLFHFYLITERDEAEARAFLCCSLPWLNCAEEVQHRSLLHWCSRVILWGKQSERGKREALRWREILPCLKRIYALGDDQMAEAQDMQQKERSNKVVRIEETDDETWRRRGSVLHEETFMGEREWSVRLHAKYFVCLFFLQNGNPELSTYETFQKQGSTLC